MSDITGSKPNILIIITDQQRQFQYWPADFVPENLPSVRRLAQHGMTFNNACIATSACSPSRASFITSSYPQQNGVNDVSDRHNLDADLPTFLKMLRDEAGYEVVWKGKWHLIREKGYVVDALHQYGATPSSDEGADGLGWNPTDAGTSLNINYSLGGGVPDNDDRFAGHAYNCAHEQAVKSGVRDYLLPQQTEGTSAPDYLQSYVERAPGRPFCLVVSLVNPHDAHVFSDKGGYAEAGYPEEDFANLGIELPPNYDDDLLTKPSIQQATSEGIEGSAASNITDESNATLFCNFYAYLHTVVEQDIRTVLDALDDNNLTDGTLIVRFSDHGEQGLSHAMREKENNAYEETIHVPLVFSNPRWYPDAQETDSVVSLLDLYPTLAEIAIGENWTQPPSKTYTLPESSENSNQDVDYQFTGTSLVPILESSAEVVHEDGVVFSYDTSDNDCYPSYIRCLRTPCWKYAIYFNSHGDFEYELYMLEQDPNEMINIAYNARNDPSSAPVWGELHQQLNSLMEDLGVTPITASSGKAKFPDQLDSSVAWPDQPAPWFRPKVSG